MKRSLPESYSGTGGTTGSRRHALALMLGGVPLLRRALAAAEGGAPVRFLISESLVSDVNIADARAAMLIWLRRMEKDLNVVVELDPRVFQSTEEILHRARRGQFDSVALNALEYRQIADVLDPGVVLAPAGEGGTEQYLLLARRDRGFNELSKLRGSRLCALTAPRMCVAPAWLSATLDEAHLGPSEQFFGSVATDTKASRVILPVFFGQTDACLASKRTFDTMSELNPQVAKALAAIASSPPMVVTFYIFHKNFTAARRDRFIRALSGVRDSAAGRQLATLFQFEELAVRDASCLTGVLDVLKKAERAHGRVVAGGRKG
jgi:ABC-type phosphate/phosphonate transport system substrate-binding protein